MNRWIYIVPVLAFLVIAGFLFVGLQRAKVTAPNELPSALIDKPIPQTILPPLDAQTQGFGPQDFTKGKVILVNVFSSTCVPCRVEAPVLDRLAKMPGITIYGFVWKDKAANAREFLDELGNPFQRIGLDTSGRLGVEWGIYGWPATYLIDKHGIIRDMIWGGVTDEIVKDRLLPQIEKLQQAS
jgi:cytochrome c biogenesis protein CcmG/thiol:disulfide interchange protein DsbE